MADNAQNYDFEAQLPLHLYIGDFGVFIKLVIAAWSQILFALPQWANLKPVVGLWYVLV